MDSVHGAMDRVDPVHRGGVAVVQGLARRSRIGTGGAEADLAHGAALGKPGTATDVGGAGRQALGVVDALVSADLAAITTDVVREALDKIVRTIRLELG